MVTDAMRAIQQRIMDDGKISFATYMELALYHPSGYYGQSVRIGGAGADFYTASQFLVFGWTLGRYIVDEWQRFLRPLRLQVVEVGAGQGELASYICDYLARNMPAEVIVEYVIVEASPHLQKVQQNRLGSSGKGAISVSWGEPDAKLDTVLVANEVLDALPVERLRLTSAGWLQGWVQMGEPGQLTHIWEPAPSALATLADAWLPIPMETEAELCTRLPDFFRTCSAYGGRMTGLFFDYGIHKDELSLGIRPNGTVRGYFQHRVVDVLVHPGTCDITADVLWEHALHTATHSGWDSVALSSQGKFLMDAGIAAVLEQLWNTSEQNGIRSDTATRQFKQLILPGGMGERFSTLTCRRRV